MADKLKSRLLPSNHAPDRIFLLSKSIASCENDAPATLNFAKSRAPPLRINKQIHLTSVGRLLSLTGIALMLSTISASALEQCRFIQAKPEREACYQRQESELATKRKVAEPRRDRTIEALEQMKHEDEALNRQIHGICRGC
jgi:hypothetical protein